MSAADSIASATALPMPSTDAHDRPDALMNIPTTIPQHVIGRIQLLAPESLPDSRWPPESPARPCWSGQRPAARKRPRSRCIQGTAGPVRR